MSKFQLDLLWCTLHQHMNSGGNVNSGDSRPVSHTAPLPSTPTARRQRHGYSQCAQLDPCAASASPKAEQIPSSTPSATKSPPVLLLTPGNTEACGEAPPVLEATERALDLIGWPLCHGVPFGVSAVRGAIGWPVRPKSLNCKTRRKTGFPKITSADFRQFF